MSKQTKSSIEAYEFRADFESKPDTPVAEQVKMDAAELATLLAQARSEGVAEALAQVQREDAQRLDGVAGQLNGALANLVELAGHLDAASTDAALAETSMQLINSAAKRIVDGQGDLFSAAQPSLEGDNAVEVRR
jgi:hypothetical protein